MDHVIGGKFKLGRKIGSGSFGQLYLGPLFGVCRFRDHVQLGKNLDLIDFDAAAKMEA